MSHVAHTEPKALRVRLPLWIKLAAVSLIAGAAVALFFVVSANDEATRTPTTAAPRAAAGVRYDGGREEASRGLVRHGSAVGVRYGGGPEEGGHGIRHSTAASAPQVYVNPSTGYASTRYDSGHEKGTADVTAAELPRVDASPGARYDGGPEEGSSGPGR